MSELSLSQWLQEPVEHSMAASLSVLKEVADALDAAQGVGKLHGNLSPAQIRVRVEDLGQNVQSISAQLIGFGRESPVQSSLDIGTPPPEAAYYFAPEKILGSRVTKQSDQFSLGVIAYEMLCGIRPFDAPNLPALFHRICTKQPEPQCESLEPAVHRILNRAMAKNPDERFASCTSFLEALQTALGGPVRPAAAAANVRTERPPTSSGERFGAVGAGMTGAAVGTVRGAYLHRDESAGTESSLRDDDFFERPEPMTRFEDDFAPGSRRNRFVHNPIDEMADLTEDPRLAGPFKRNRAWLIPLLAFASLAIAFFFLQAYLPLGRWQSVLTGETNPSEPAPSSTRETAPVESPTASSALGSRTPPDSQTDSPASASQPKGTQEGTADPAPATEGTTHPDDTKAGQASPSAPPMPSDALGSRTAPTTTDTARSATDLHPRTRPTEVPHSDDSSTSAPYRTGASSLPTYSPRTGRPVETDPLAVTSVELFTTPPGSRIEIDGRSDIGCQSPCSLSLTSGRHTLTAEQDGFAVARRIFNVPEDRSLFIPLIKGVGTLVLSTQPQGSTVTIDGKPAGVTPFTIRLTAGPHRVDMVRGTQHHQESIEIQSDALQTRAFTW